MRHTPKHTPKQVLVEHIRALHDAIAEASGFDRMPLRALIIAHRAAHTRPGYTKWTTGHSHGTSADNRPMGWATGQDVVLHDEKSEVD